jgi:hypothetical protein
MDDCDSLIQLNRDLFAAEEKAWIGDEPWDHWLGRVLAQDFTIRRSNAAVPRQGRDTMIRWIRERQGVPRRLLPPETLWSCRSLGVITGPVLMPDGMGQVRRYQNIKVCRRHPAHGWQCVYWQVTEEPAP